MPKVLNMIVEGVRLNEVVGDAFLPGKSVKVTETLEGSSLNITLSAHLVAFTLPRELLALLQPVLKLHSEVRFSADYSTGEKVRDAVVQVKRVEPQDRGDVEYVFSVSPMDVVLDASETGGGRISTRRFLNR